MFNKVVYKFRGAKTPGWKFFEKALPMPLKRVRENW
jgi:hypothetical protein